MDWILVIVSSSYIIFVTLLIIGWRGAPVRGIGGGNDPFISVIIPVRDEASNIVRLLDDLEGQSYPADRFEVIIVDDGSKDGTYPILLARQQRTKLNLKILQAPSPGGIAVSPKKIAITHGIDHAEGEFILLTDGDVHLGISWIQSYATIFAHSSVVFVSGPVMMAYVGFMEEVQAIEFASLMGTGAALISFGKPSMCNGANLGFRRDAFMKVDGYEGNQHIISGDDEFLMYKIKRQFPSGIFFLKSMHGVAEIQPLHNLKDFYLQRRRWSGKWKKHSNPTAVLLALYVFTVHLIFLILLLAGLIKSISINIVIIIWVAKMVVEYILLHSIFRFCGRRMGIAPFIISSLLYSLYAVTFGILSNIGGVEWKGRKFKD